MTQDLPVFVGGKKILPVIADWPRQDEAVNESLIQAFESGNWGKYHGEFHDVLSEKIRAKFETKHVRLCSSGTVATEIALRSIPVSAGDEVILAAYDFPGNFRAVEATGAFPVLVDISQNHWSMSGEISDESFNDRTKAIIVSHLHGSFAEIESIVRKARERNIAVIEDFCQCPGAMIGTKIAGTFGDIATMSFGGSKLLSAGRGGVMLTQSDDLAQRATIYCERGNEAFPLSELQAAALVPQFDLLDERNAKRLQNVQELVRLINAEKSLATLKLEKENLPAFYKVPIQIADAKLKENTSRSVLVSALQAEGVNIDIGFRGFGNRSKRRCRKPVPLPFAERAATETMLIHHPVLLENPETIELLAKAISRVCDYFLNK